eukprot:jgi/Mesen1/5630/ME000282S04771
MSPSGRDHSLPTRDSAGRDVLAPRGRPLGEASAPPRPPPFSNHHINQQQQEQEQEQEQGRQERQQEQQQEREEDPVDMGSLKKPRPRPNPTRKLRVPKAPADSSNLTSSPSRATRAANGVAEAGAEAQPGAGRGAGVGAGAAASAGADAAPSCGDSAHDGDGQDAVRLPRKGEEARVLAHDAAARVREHGREREQEQERVQAREQMRARGCGEKEEERQQEQGRDWGEGEFRLEYDGASKGNPGPAGAGAVLFAPDGSVVEEVRVGCGIATNNHAEYRGLIGGLRAALRRDVRRIRVRGDSTLVCKQVKGLWAVKAEPLRPLVEEARRLMASFKFADIIFVRREHNAHADRLANEGVLLEESKLERLGEPGTPASPAPQAAAAAAAGGGGGPDGAGGGSHSGSVGGHDSERGKASKRQRASRGGGGGGGGRGKSTRTARARAGGSGSLSDRTETGTGAVAAAAAAAAAGGGGGMAFGPLPAHRSLKAGGCRLLSLSQDLRCELGDPRQGGIVTTEFHTASAATIRGLRSSLGLSAAVRQQRSALAQQRAWLLGPAVLSAALASNCASVRHRMAVLRAPLPSRRVASLFHIGLTFAALTFA